MSNRRQLMGLLLGATLLIAACTSGTGGSPTASAAAGASAGAAAITVNAASAAGLGTILTGPDGRTLYTHAGDSTDTSTCTGACLSAWPPLTIAAGQQVTAGSGVTGTLASFARADGSLWVTYGGMPLYYWQGDAKPGDVTGQGVDEFAVATVSGSAGASGGGASQAPAGGASQPSDSGGYSY
jgi:predicted lipoprotein with Yx(FWY)xxD motif